MPDFFRTRQPNVADNNYLRTPQREAFVRVSEHYQEENPNREIGVVLPVGCGKSGLITIVPFASQARRVLVVAPNVNISQQLLSDFDPTDPRMFYLKCHVLPGGPYPEPVEIRGTTTNRGDLDEADVVVTNIQQLQGEDNRWLTSLPEDYFDLILFDEAHHNVAASWELIRSAFPNARIINFSATPRRADGQLMSGDIKYCYPIFRAIEEGYVKRLKAILLNPRTLRYVRRENEQEISVSSDEVRRLGETDADFRRSIVTSKETLNTIVDASIRELDRIRTETGDNRHKIIASALNFEHCIQIVEAYRAKGRRADYVHSRESSENNSRVYERLKHNELDVIVQVRKLGEGFDHPFLSVAAVFSVFKELSPFVQFVGRIMRVIEQNNPSSIQNQGTVVFHAGANIARLWEDFQDFSQADQEYFDQLLMPIEELNFDTSDEIEVVPAQRNRSENTLEIKGQDGVLLQEIPLILQDLEVQDALRTLQQKGITPEIYKQAYELTPVPTTKVRQRQAARAALDAIIRNEAGRILNERNINPKGHELDKRFLGRENFVVLKSAIDKHVNRFVGKTPGTRSDFTRQELDKIKESLDMLVDNAVKEVLDA